jgi:hypothetical protein
MATTTTASVTEGGTERLLRPRAGGGVAEVARETDRRRGASGGSRCARRSPGRLGRGHAARPRRGGRRTGARRTLAPWCGPARSSLRVRGGLLAPRECPHPPKRSRRSRAALPMQLAHHSRSSASSGRPTAACGTASSEPERTAKPTCFSPRSSSWASWGSSSPSRARRLAGLI